MEVKGGNITVFAVLVRFKGVKAIGSTIIDIFGRLEGEAGNVSVVCSVDNPRRSARLRILNAVSRKWF